MQDRKDKAWAREHGDVSDDGVVAGNRKSGADAGSDADSDGWQQYRRWISKAPAPRGRRSGVDPSLYTWKGYRTWTEKVKRNWQDN